MPAPVILSAKAHKRSFLFLCNLCVVFAACFGQNAFAQDLSLEEIPGLRERAVVLQIRTRVNENSQEVWNAFNSKVTVPGRPVGIKLVGENIVVSIQFTPYLQEKGKTMLVAQGQIWVNLPERGMSYKTTMQSLFMEFGEPVYFFPLGSENDAAGDPLIELQLSLYRYGEEPQEESAPPAPPETKAPASGTR
ncbi:MAG: hypothetical protein LBJ31_02385 [Treponema sp.]|jgi:hypothetical protein|nr:hypothetical protein [Treponema sp.]